MNKARGYIRITEIFLLIVALNLMVFNIIPALAHLLPVLFWLPFDPYATGFRYVSSYAYEASCSIFGTAISSLTSMYMYVVFICLSFNYELLGERAQAISFTNGTDNKKRSPQSSKADVYNDMVDLIKLHLKMNE